MQDPQTNPGPTGYFNPAKLLIFAFQIGRMNFLSHFYLDRQVPDSLFIAGVSTPDLVSIYDRKVRLHKNQLPAFEEGNKMQRQFLAGLHRHFEVDGIFHDSDFFRRETTILGKLMREHFQPKALGRTFFVAHILFELLLDKLLIAHDENLCGDFYRHLENQPISKLVALTQWTSGKRLEGYEAFISRFIRNRYLFHYARWDQILLVLRRVVQGVGIRQTDYMDTGKFLEMLVDYEKQLARRWAKGFDQLRGQLRPLPET